MDGVVAHFKVNLCQRLIICLKGYQPSPLLRRTKQGTGSECSD